MNTAKYSLILATLAFLSLASCASAAEDWSGKGQVVTLSPGNVVSVINAEKLIVAACVTRSDGTREVVVLRQYYGGNSTMGISVSMRAGDVSVFGCYTGAQVELRLVEVTKTTAKFEVK